MNQMSRFTPARWGASLLLGLCTAACSGDRIPPGTLRVDPFQADGLEAGAVSGQLVRVRYSGLATKHGIRLTLEGPGHTALETRELITTSWEREQAFDLDLAVRVEFQKRMFGEQTRAWLNVWIANAFEEGTSSTSVDLTDDIPEDLSAFSTGTQTSSALGDRPVAEIFHVRFAKDSGAVRLEYFVE